MTNEAVKSKMQTHEMTVLSQFVTIQYFRGENYI